MGSRVVTDEKSVVRVGSDQRSIAIRTQMGKTPALMWVGGFRSLMTGTKATALADMAADQQRAFVRFDYSGFGDSEGDFLDGTISRWLEEAKAVAESITSGPILVGSSMGGWISLLVAEWLFKAGTPAKALILIAPAADMTDRLIGPSLGEDARAALVRDGVYYAPSAYDDGPYPITAKLIDDGRQHSVLGRQVRTGCPIHILHGEKDPDVPVSLSRALLASLSLEQVSMTIIPDGDHRLSRDEDIALLKRIVAGYACSAANMASSPDL